MFPTTPILDTFTHADGALDASIWTNANGNSMWYLSNGCGFNPGIIGDMNTVGSLYLPVGPLTEAESYVTDVASRAIAVGVRCQSPYLPGSYAFPIGYWFLVTASASPAVGAGSSFFAQNSTGSRPILASGTSPGYSPGDLIGIRICGTTLTGYINSTLILTGTTDFNVGHPYLADGGLGMGFAGTTDGDPLVDDFGGGESTLACSATSFSGTNFRVAV